MSHSAEGPDPDPDERDGSSGGETPDAEIWGAEIWGAEIWGAGIRGAEIRAEEIRAADEPQRVHSVSSSRGYRPLDFTQPSHGWTSSVWWLYGPVALLLGLALWQRTDEPARPGGFDEPDAPDSLSASAIIDGWSARIDGSGLTLRLEPLHPVTARQAFDAVALAARFRGDGDPASPDAQPWRLTLVAEEGEDMPAHVIDDLSAVTIEGLEPLVLDAAGPIDQAPSDRASSDRAQHGQIQMDPLATLFRFPSAPLRAGESCDLVFWGPQPGKEVAVSAPGLDGAAVLRELARSTSPSSSSIARLDARRGTGSQPR